MGGDITRRDALSILGGGSVALLAGCADSTGSDREDPSLEQENILEIPAGRTRSISASGTEVYDSVLWESTGRLELETDAAIKLEDISN